MRTRDIVWNEILEIGGIVVKRYLSVIFIALSIVTVILGHVIDFYWSGVVAWGIGVVLLILAAYFTKFIPNDNKKNKTNDDKTKA